MDHFFLQVNHLMSEQLSKWTLTHFWLALKMVAGNGLCQAGVHHNLYKVYWKPLSNSIEAKRAGLH